MVRSRQKLVMPTFTAREFAGPGGGAPTCLADHERGGVALGWIEGKVAVVTGAATGLGKGFAEALAAAGADLSLCDVREDVADVAEALAKEHGIASRGLGRRRQRPGRRLARRGRDGGRARRHRHPREQRRHLPPGRP